MSQLVLVMSQISYRYEDKFNISNNIADESLFSQDLATGRSKYEHAALHCDRCCGEAWGRNRGGSDWMFWILHLPVNLSSRQLSKLVSCSFSCCTSEVDVWGTTGLKMNLYRSFGNLMEAWVTEEGQCSGNNDEDSPSPSSDTGTTLRSDSVDSGVETASSDTSFPATPCSISTDNAEKDTFTPQREGEGLTPASTSQSPVFSSPVPSVTSSSSPRICPRGAPEGSTTLHQKVEQALQRTNSKNPEPLTVDEVLRRRPRASFLPKRHASELVRGQRPESCGLRRTVNQSMTVRQMSEMCRRPMSRSFDKQSAQTTSEVRYCLCSKPNFVIIFKHFAFLKKAKEIQAFPYCV